jgi:hypothetical protein
MIYRGPDFLATVWFGSSPSPPSPASCLSFSVFLCVAGPAYWWEKRGRGRSQIIRRRGSLVLYKAFNTLCSALSFPPPLSTGGVFGVLIALLNPLRDVLLCRLKNTLRYRGWQNISGVRSKQVWGRGWGIGEFSRIYTVQQGGYKEMSILADQ